MRSKLAWTGPRRPSSLLRDARVATAAHVNRKDWHALFTYRPRSPKHIHLFKRGRTLLAPSPTSPFARAPACYRAPGGWISSSRKLFISVTSRTGRFKPMWFESTCGILVQVQFSADWSHCWTKRRGITFCPMIFCLWCTFWKNKSGFYHLLFFVDGPSSKSTSKTQPGTPVNPGAWTPKPKSTPTPQTLTPFVSIGIWTLDAWPNLGHPLWGKKNLALAVVHGQLRP